MKESAGSDILSLRVDSMATVISTTYHLSINFNKKRDKNDFLEEQLKMMEEIEAPHRKTYLCLYQSPKNISQLTYNTMAKNIHINLFKFLAKLTQKTLLLLI